MAGTRIFFQAINLTTGDLEAGVSFAASGEAQISVNGANYVDIQGAAPHSIGGGDYYYELDVDDGATAPTTVLLKIRKANYAPTTVEKDLLEIGAEVLASLRAWGHDTGVTFDGLVKRLEAIMTGRKTETTVGTVRTISWHLKDGTTVAVESTVDLITGERADSDVSGSE